MGRGLDEIGVASMPPALMVSHLRLTRKYRLELPSRQIIQSP
jgi:hypothetical protein